MPPPRRGRRAGNGRPQGVSPLAVPGAELRPPTAAAGVLAQVRLHRGARKGGEPAPGGPVQLGTRPPGQPLPRETVQESQDGARDFLGGPTRGAARRWPSFQFCMTPFLPGTTLDAKREKKRRHLSLPFVTALTQSAGRSWHSDLLTRT